MNTKTNIICVLIVFFQMAALLPDQSDGAPGGSSREFTTSGRALPNTFKIKQGER